MSALARETPEMDALKAENERLRRDVDNAAPFVDQREEIARLDKQLTAAEGQNVALREVANELAQACRAHAEVRKKENKSQGSTMTKISDETLTSAIQSFSETLNDRFPPVVELTCKQALGIYTEIQTLRELAHETLNTLNEYTPKEVRDILAKWEKL